MLGKIKEVIFSCFLWIIIGLITAGIVCFMTMILLFFTPFDPNRKMAHTAGIWWGRLIFAINPRWHIKIQGRGYLRNNKAYVLVANHASISDIVFIYHLRKQFKWVAKESLFRIPVLGWGMRIADYVPLKRGRHGSIRDSFEGSKRWLKRNMSVLYFPEGTRSRTGQIGAFKNGAFKLALSEKVPVVPIVLCGTEKIIQKGKAAMPAGFNVRLRVLKPISTVHMKEKEFGDLRNTVRTKMISALEAMR